MNDLSNARPDKFRAYRARKKAVGLREMRMWVPDVDNEQFQRALADQISRINASEEERQVLASAENAAAEIWTSLD